MLRPEYLEKCAAVIALSCEEPWNAIKSFDRWIEVLMDVLEEHMKGLPLKMQDSLHEASKV